MPRLLLPLILASGSPRRADILRQAGIPFEVVLPKTAEDSQEEGGRPWLGAKRNALRKARSVSRDRPGRIVVGADTMVVCGSEVLGKPGTRKEAVAMLEKLSGRDHIVITGIALSRWEDGQAEEETSYERTVVSFKQLGKSEIHAYVASGEPLDKAGGYGIQGKGACLVQGIRGCYFNVVGLPLYRLCDMLKRWDYDIPW